MRSVIILIPAYNEADCIRATIESAKKISGIEKIVVIDDGSSDDTSKLALEAGAEVVRIENNCGKGAALNFGVSKYRADIYLLLDADLGDSAANAGELLAPVLHGDADMTISVIKSPEGHKGGFGLVKGLARWAVRRYGGTEISAPISGQRAVKREIIEAVGGFDERFGVEVALTIDALKEGFRIIEIPLEIRHKVTGRNLKGFIHRGRQFKDIVKAVWRRR